MTRRRGRIIKWEYVVDFTEAISRVFPDFAEERKDVKSCMVRSLACARLIREGDDNFFYVITCKDVDNMGTSYKTFRRLLKKYPLFVCIDEYYSLNQGIARKYLPTEYLYQALSEVDSVIKQPTDIFWRRKGGRSILSNIEHTPERPKSLEDSDYSCVAEVDPKSAMKYVSDRGVEKYGCRMLVIMRALNIIKRTNGVVAQHYFRGDCGRLYGRGSESLQTMPKNIRKELFKGKFEYDFKNSHYSLASHFTDNASVIHYAKNPEDVRSMISGDIGITESDVKSSLLMLICGAARDLRKGSSLEKLLGKEKGKEFLNHPFVSDILAGVDDLKDNLLRDGKIKRGKKTSMGSQLANFIMSQEAIVLDACIAEVKPELLLFDGFISREDKAPEYFEEIIQRETGFDIRVSKRQL